MATRCITIENVNPRLKMMKNAILASLAARAEELETQLSKGNLPFNKLIRADRADRLAMGQMPMTYIRQILSMIVYPPLIEDSQFSDDMKKRARDILSGCKGQSVGSYSDASGIEPIRRHFADYIQKRDGGVLCDWQNVFLCSGAVDGIKKVVKLLVCQMNGLKAGILLPNPRSPSYSMIFSEFDMKPVNYYLDEAKNWDIDLTDLEKSIQESRTTCNPRALVVINPGNPTGHVLSRQKIEDIIKVAYKENLFLLADEVYQDNIYNNDTQFISFKKVLTEMGPPYSGMQLASFMSCSKGYFGECGVRGGSIEIINLCPQVKAMFLKSITAMLCPTVLGQSISDCIITPPSIGEESYELYMKEKTSINESLKKQAKMLGEGLNSLEGIHCTAIQGSMFAFPRINLPNKAIETAEEDGYTPDAYYALKLLENTGICVIPGSEFGERKGTYHLGITMMLPSEILQEMLYKFSEFHKWFLKEFI